MIVIECVGGSLRDGRRVQVNRRLLDMTSRHYAC